MNYFKCYSLNLKRFMSANGVKFLSSGWNDETHRLFFIYLRDERFNELLACYNKQFEGLNEAR